MIENMWSGELFEWNYRKRINGWLAKMHIYNQEQSCQKWHKSKINSFKNSHFAYWTFKLKLFEIHERVTGVRVIPENRIFSFEQTNRSCLRDREWQLTYMTVYFHWFGPTPDRLFLYYKKCDAESVNLVKAF